MKLTTLVQALMIAGAATSLGASIVSAEVQQIPSSAVSCYFVGRLYFDANGIAQVAGYFSDINGIGASNSLFNGTPSESRAFFTFRSDLLKNTSLPSNGDITLILGPAGSFNIYYNPSPQGNWNNPDSFSAGQKFPGHPIAQFTRPEFLASCSNHPVNRRLPKPWSQAGISSSVDTSITLINSPRAVSPSTSMAAIPRFRRYPGFHSCFPLPEIVSPWGARAKTSNNAC